jgi:hypothetical protein
MPMSGILSTLHFIGIKVLTLESTKYLRLHPLNQINPVLIEVDAHSLCH